VPFLFSEIFGDAVKGFDQAVDEVSRSHLIIITGTSLSVSPFNQLPAIAASRGIPIVHVNNQVNPTDRQLFKYILQGDISEICELLMKDEN
jgi:NAD-dependent deacetylase